MADAHANFATSLVATAPSPAASGISLVVTGGEGTRFPAVPFNAVVCPAGANATPANAEVVRVTARDTDTLTITRTQESSSARTVIVGDRIFAGPTAKSLTDIEGNHAASISTIEPDDAAAAGSATTWARGDHKHAIAAAAPTGMAAWVGAAAEGSATSFARSDHKHGVPFSASTEFVMSVAQYAAAPVSTATGVANTYYAIGVTILAPMTLTGVEFRNGATTNGNVRAALYNAFGVRVADRTSDLAQAGSANANRKVPFDATYDALPGSYFALIWFSSATATAFMAYVLGTRVWTGTNATTTPTSLAGPFVAQTAPVLCAY